MSSNFNSRLKPAEVLVKDGKALLIRKRDEFEAAHHWKTKEEALNIE